MVLDWLVRKPGSAPLVIAHRGSSGVAPENTIASLELAVSQGATAVECDVVLSADGVPIVIHDTTLDRTTSGSGDVSALDWSDLAKLDAGSWKDTKYGTERLLRLSDLLHRAKGRARIIIELKAGDPATLAQTTLEAIEANPGADTAVISFVPAVVEAVRRTIPGVAVGYLYSRHWPWATDHADVISRARAIGAHFVSPEYSLATEEFCSAAHIAGMPVSVWTCNDAESMRSLADAGVDAVTTDWPDSALKTYR
jgi:glycerophosphoryl diester phosphodiesterase